MNDKEFLLKLIKCLTDEERERVKFLSSRCIEMDGVRMKDMMKKPFEFYVSSVRNYKYGEKNINYLLHAIWGIRNMDDVPMERGKIFSTNSILSKAKTMRKDEFEAYMDEKGVPADKLYVEDDENNDKENADYLTPSRVAGLWLCSKIEDRDDVEQLLEKLIETRSKQTDTATDKENEQQETAEENIEMQSGSDSVQDDKASADLKKKIKKLQNDNQNLKIKNDNLKKEYDASKRDVKKYKDDLGKANKELFELKNQIEIEKRNNQSLSSKSSEKDKEIEKFKEKNKALSEELKSIPRVVLFCRSDEKYIRLPHYRVEIIHTPIGLEDDHLEKCVAVWVVTSDYTYAELLKIRKSVKIPTREFYSLNQMIEELEA